MGKSVPRARRRHGMGSFSGYSTRPALVEARVWARLVECMAERGLFQSLTHGWYLVASQNAEWFDDLLGGIVVGGLTSHELNKWTESDLTSAGWINNSQNALELGLALLDVRKSQN